MVLVCKFEFGSVNVIMDECQYELLSFSVNVIVSESLCQCE